MENLTLDKVIDGQCFDGLADALNEIEYLRYKLETVPQISRLIMGDRTDISAETAEQIYSMIHYTEFLVKELDAQIEKANDCYNRLNGCKKGAAV